MRKITKISKKKVTISRKDWDELWNRLRDSLPQFNIEMGGGCDDFCGAACADDDGCDLSFGSEPECGAYCLNGEVYLQEEV